ncbi:hypothetical protein GEMRC1_013754 [Eukaryota sp. GEM-RC1]
MVEMLSNNNILIQFSISAEQISNDSIQNILKAGDTNSTLKYVSLQQLLSNPTNLSPFIMLYKALATGMVNIYLDISPHLIDVKIGLFNFSPHRHCKLSNEEVSSLISFVRTFSIKYLTLQRCTLSNESINELCDLIKLNSSLTSVDFTGCRMADPNVMKLINAIELNFSLKSINLSNNWLSFKSLLIILELVLNGELQVQLDVSPHVADVEEGMFCFCPVFYLPITVEQLLSLQNFPKSFTLRNFTLNRCQFSEESISALCDLIKCGSSLTSIDFSLCSLSDCYFMKILSSLQHNSYVNGLHLTLESNSIGNTGVLALAKALRLGLPLTKLNLSNNMVGTEGVMALVEALNHNSTVETIDLQHSSIEVDIQEYAQKVSNGRIKCLQYCPHSDPDTKKDDEDFCKCM